MIRNIDSKKKYIYSFVAALVVHAVIFAFVKKDLYDFEFLSKLSEATKNLQQPIKLDQINIIKKEDVEKFRTVGIKNGRKDLQRPDLVTKRQDPPAKKGSPSPNLSFDNLAPQLPKPIPNQHTADKNSAPKSPSPARKAPNEMARNYLKDSSDNDSGSHFYFNKNQKIIPRSQEQDDLKVEAVKNLNAPMNKATEKISNFEIRYDRPEGVSEDELNSDEKAYYSFYVRSYKNYFAKIYSNYEKIVIERPGLAKVFDRKHLLIGKIDYDEQGNIITVRILKSSESDDLAYFFEETLKQLTQPNPPKIFTKNKKQFSIYYQIQIN